MSKRRRAKDLAKANPDKKRRPGAEAPISEHRRIDSTFDHSNCRGCHMLDYLGFDKDECSEEETGMVSECCLHTFINNPAGFMEEFADPMGAIVSMILLGDDRPYDIPLPNGGKLSITYRPPEAPVCVCTGARGPVSDKEADP